MRTLPFYDWQGGGAPEFPQSPNVDVGGRRNQGNGNKNPDGTLPLPPPDGTIRPVGYYESDWSAIGWDVGTGQIQRTGVWGSAVLNLRTDLRGVSSREPGGVPLNRQYAVQLWIAISGLGQNHSGMELYKADLGHPFDPDKARQYTPWQNITADISTGTDQVILDYFPPGSGYQMQYWQVKLRFDFLSKSPLILPLINVCGAAY
jgi:hypothetical protein